MNVSESIGKSTGNGVKIVIVDSGLSENQRLRENHNLHTFVKYDTLNEQTITRQDIDDNFGHGTAIYKIIKDIAVNATIIVLKLFTEEFQISEQDLLAALHFIDQNIDCNIINLSLGLSMTESLEELHAICKKLYEKNIVICSAFDNDGSMSYPASFDFVIGVDSSEKCKNKNQFEYVEGKYINILARGATQRVLWKNDETIFMKGNSFACAHVTAIVAKMMACGISGLTHVLETFKNLSIHQHLLKDGNPITSFLPVDSYFKINRAIIFPYNKEVHSIINFCELLQFKLVGLFDHHLSPYLNKNVKNHFFGSKPYHSVEFIVKKTDDIEWQSFDTLILSHTDKLMNILGSDDIVRELLAKAIEYEKNIYAFDDMSPYQEIIKTRKPYSKFYYPKIDSSDLPKLRFGKMYKLSKPIVGVFGTSSIQGKFTLQLIMRKILLEKGYSVGQLGTEPSSLLYGMDAVYPMGYNATVMLHGNEAIYVLNDMMQNIIEKNPDIIIVGSQSATIPYQMTNINMLTQKQIELLMGTSPDVVVLCVNPYDSYDYIYNTIKFIESAVSCNVIALVLYPMNLQTMYHQKIKMTLEEIENDLEKLKQSFQLPAFSLFNYQDIDMLTDIVVDHFC